MSLLRQVVAAFASYDTINTNKRSQRLTSPSTRLPSLADLIKISIAGTFSADNFMLSEFPKNMKTVGGSVEWESRHCYSRPGPTRENSETVEVLHGEYKLWESSTTLQLHPPATACITGRPPNVILQNSALTQLEILQTWRAVQKPTDPLVLFSICVTL